MNSKFFNFVGPFLAIIDNGKLFRKPFSWLYSVIAIINLLLPAFILYQAIANNIFSAPAKFIIVLQN